MSLNAKIAREELYRRSNEIVSESAVSLMRLTVSKSPRRLESKAL